MFDTHCHLNFDVFDKNFIDVIRNAKSLGVDHFMIPSTNILNFRKAVDIANNFGNIYVAIGIHPTEKLEEYDFDKTISKLQKFIDDSEDVLAVGEIGLDYYKNDNYEIQRKFFAGQLKLAIKNPLSVIIHNRHAGDDLLKLLDSNWKDILYERVVFHCCEPDQKLLDYALKQKIFIGVDGDVTYDQKKMGFIKKVPLEHLVVETDSPFLTPYPVRQNNKFPNEPKYLDFVVRTISELKNKDYKSVAKITSNNAMKLFKL
jgi:TatD DNase family protein